MAGLSLTRGIQKIMLKMNIMQKNKLGIWEGQFIEPYKWRKKTNKIILNSMKLKNE